MSALTRYFFDTVYFPPSAVAVLRWWEARRPAYNAAVGAAGLVTLAGVALLGALPPLRIVATVVAVYGLLANVCYSFGPLAELAARRWGGSAFAPVGPALLRYGFVFSIGLTLFPLGVAVLWWIVRLAVLASGA